MRGTVACGMGLCFPCGASARGVPLVRQRCELCGLVRFPCDAKGPFGSRGCPWCGRWRRVISVPQLVFVVGAAGSLYNTMLALVDHVSESCALCSCHAMAFHCPLSCL